MIHSVTWTVTAFVGARITVQSTRIRFKGRPIVRDADERYEIKPGRWVVDSFVRLPEQTEPGIYAYEIEFDGTRVDFDKRLTFVVRAP